MGLHRFYHTHKGQSQEKVSGTYKFVQVWQFKDGLWKLVCDMSYGHNQMHKPKQYPVLAYAIHALFMYRTIGKYIWFGELRNDLFVAKRFGLKFVRGE